MKANRITSSALDRMRRGGRGRLRLGAVALLHAQLHGDRRRCARRAATPSWSGRSPSRRRSTGRSSWSKWRPNRVDVDEFNRWAAPLNDSIARVVAGDLAVLLGTPRVATAPLANFNPAYRVTIDVQRFESVHGRSRR